MERHHASGSIDLLASDNFFESYISRFQICGVTNRWITRSRSMLFQPSGFRFACLNLWVHRPRNAVPILYHSHQVVVMPWRRSVSGGFSVYTAIGLTVPLWHRTPETWHPDYLSAQRGITTVTRIRAAQVHWYHLGLAVRQILQVCRLQVGLLR